MLVGCFYEKDGNGKAYTFVNMWEPSEEKTAEFTASFEEGKTVTVYRKGEKEVIVGSTLTMTLEVGEGMFVEVK